MLTYSIDQRWIGTKARLAYVSMFDDEDEILIDCLILDFNNGEFKGEFPVCLKNIGIHKNEVADNRRRNKIITYLSTINIIEIEHKAIYEEDDLIIYKVKLSQLAKLKLI